jgi:hypothetical protein
MDHDDGEEQPEQQAHVDPGVGDESTELEVCVTRRSEPAVEQLVEADTADASEKSEQ